MGHMLDETTGQAAIAYRAENGVPWHGLGRAILPTDDIDAIVAKAGLAHQVMEAKVLYDAQIPVTPGTLPCSKPMGVPDRKVLYRSDTLSPLAVVSKDYQVVQPREVVAFFDEMVKSGGFTIDTAGALSGGKRVWAMATIGEGANIIGQDRVLPRLLCATSYDGSMATTVKYIKERVVCHNTITSALGEDGKEIRVYHSQRFDATEVRRDMGIALTEFETWLLKARLAATAALTDDRAGQMTEILLRPHTQMEDVTKSRGFQAIMSLFKGEAIGSGLTQGGTAWQWLNGVTQFVDHGRGRGADTRMNSAWFGEGDKLKSQAEKMAFDLVA